MKIPQDPEKQDLIEISRSLNAMLSIAWKRFKPWHYTELQMNRVWLHFQLLLIA